MIYHCMYYLIDIDEEVEIQPYPTSDMHDSNGNDIYIRPLRHRIIDHIRLN